VSSEITGGGADETAHQVSVSIPEVERPGQTGGDLVSSSLAASALKDSVVVDPSLFERTALVVVNPSPFERTALVLADLPEDRACLVTASGARVPVQRLDHAPTLLDETLTDDLSRLLDRIQERIPPGHEITSWTVDDGLFTIVVSRHANGHTLSPGTPDGPRGTPDGDAPQVDALDHDVPEDSAPQNDAPDHDVPEDDAPDHDTSDRDGREALRQAILVTGPGPWRVRTLAEPVVTVAAQVTVPPLGRSVLSARAAFGLVALTRTPEATAALSAPEGTLDNGLLRVTVADDGTLSLLGLNGAEIHGVGQITHAADARDHALPPDLADGPAFVTVEEIYRGPLVSALEVTRTYRWPVAVTRTYRWPVETAPGTPDGPRDLSSGPPGPAKSDPPGPAEIGGSAGETREPRAAERSSEAETAQATADALVTTRVELRAGEPFVRCELSFDVRCRDHRIAWHARLPREAAESFPEGEFAAVQPGGDSVATLTAESFVAAGGLAVLLDHDAEYEVLRTPEPELMLTLVGPVGHLSRDRNSHHDAKPQRATPATRCQGPFSTRFAVLPYAGSRHEAGLPRLMEEYRHDLVAVPGSGPTIGTPRRQPA
jgi:alpha-mannosidase